MRRESKQFTTKYQLSMKKALMPEMRYTKGIRYTETNSKITELSLSVSVIILNVNVLNYTMKMEILADWIKKGSNYILSTKDPL